MLLKKEDNKYFISGGLTWIPLPAKIKTRKEVDELLTHGNNPKQELSYATDNFKKAILFEVYWWNGKYCQAKENENKTLVIDLPAYAADEQITDYLKQRAKTVFNKEAIIVFTQPRPEPPAEDNG